MFSGSDGVLYFDKVQGFYENIPVREVSGRRVVF